MELSNIVQVRYNKNGHSFILDLEDGNSIIYNTQNETHAVRIVETDSIGDTEEE